MRVLVGRDAPPHRGSGLPAKFWTGDGWMCGDCYDEREADRDLERG